METKIRFSRHAAFRIEQRSLEFNICAELLAEFAKQTALRACPAKKHKSKKYKTYCCYFNSALNITIYVICEECRDSDELLVKIKTFILENGRA